jgi:3-phytase
MTHSKYSPTFFLFGLALAGFFAFAACEQAQPDSSPISAEGLPVLKEAYQTTRDLNLNVDSPAVWHGATRGVTESAGVGAGESAGESAAHILFATAKEGDSILLFDAASGEVLQELGQTGDGPLEFRRPNGIWVIDDLLLVVERDNARVQVILLPDLTFVGFISHEDLRYPYGVSVHRAREGESSPFMYEMYITDNYNPALEGYPAEEQLDERVHHVRFSVDGVEERDRPDGRDELLLRYETVSLFGDITGDGLLMKVESILADPEYGRLYIADEAFARRDIKIYTLDGEFTGEWIPNRYFSSEPEGIALYACEDGSGYLIGTDQHKTEENKYVVLDRETLEYLGAFRGEITRNTDGIWLTQKAFGPFPAGAFYAVHDDGSVTAFDWRDIAAALGLERDCTVQ